MIYLITKVKINTQRKYPFGILYLRTVAGILLEKTACLN